VEELHAWISDNQFGEGTMLPKIHAAIYFLKHHGQKVVITSLDKIEEAIKGNAGTIITKGN
jgi:carbamate kinase